MGKKWKNKHQQAPPSNNQQTRLPAQPPNKLCLYPGAGESTPNEKQHYADTKQLGEQQAFWTKWQAIASIAGVLVGTSGLIFLWGTLKATKDSADAAKETARITKESLVRSNRPWLKVTHRVISPLDFTYEAQAGTSAHLVLEHTIENVGPGVALDVFSWEDIIPSNFKTFSLGPALARRSKECDARRNPDPNSMVGTVLFPNEKIVIESHVGPPLKVVQDEAAKGDGQVSFTLVGCVSYRSSIEAGDSPTHQTRYAYVVARANQSNVMAIVSPQGKWDVGLTILPQWNAD